MQTLSDTLKALERYLRPLFPLLSCREPRCLSCLFLKRFGQNSESQSSAVTGWGRRRGRAVFLILFTWKRVSS